MAVSKAELDHRIEAFSSTLRRKGLRSTHQRLEVFRELAGRTDHPDAETVYQQVSRRVVGISRDTVYRTLATLEAEGLICKTAGLGGPVRYDANTERHHHFVCNTCGSIQDFCSRELNELKLPASVSALGRAESAQVQVRGVCAGCRARKAGGRRSRKTE